MAKMNISNILGSMVSGQTQGLNLGGLLYGQQNTSPTITKYETYESPIDILVLSCASDRLKKTKWDNHKFQSILDKTLFDKLIDDDFHLAQQIRTYYEQKIMLWTIKSINLTKYRQDLNKFLNEDGKRFTEKNIGLAFTLPNFYEYDQKLESIFSGKSYTDVKKVKGKQLKELTFIDKTMRDRKNFQKKYEYWFVDNNNTINTVCIDTNNPLISIWDQLVQKPIQLNGSCLHRKYDDFEYYRLDKFDIVLP